VIVDAALGDLAVATRLRELDLHAPASIDAEVLHALRRKWVAGEVVDERFTPALFLLQRTLITRHPVTPFVHRMWQLRHNITAYDAGYVALAESLGIPLLTRDRRLARASAHAARIDYIA
jgi:predicted nucleic acid-binding protein